MIKMKKILCGLGLVLFFTVFPMVNLIPQNGGTIIAQASSQKEKALAAYQSALEKNYFRVNDMDAGDKADSFCLVNLNGDEVPELLVKCYLNGGGWGGTKGYLVYTYKNGTVQRIAALNGGESVTEVYYYKKAKTLRQDWTRWGITSRSFWKMKPTMMKAILQYTQQEYSSTRYYSNGKQVNKSKYNSVVKATVGSEKAVDVETLLKENTAANRKKYLASANAAIKLNKTSATLTLGKTSSVKLKAVVTGVKGKVKWSSNNKKVAVVSSAGTVTAKKSGTAIITAKIGKLTARCKITVKKENSVKTQNARAIAAYKKLLANKNFEGIYGEGKADAFYLLDMDGNGVKEIIIRKDKLNYIYTYSGNKAKQLLSRGGWGGNSLVYYKKSRVLLFSQAGSGVSEKTYYGLKNGKIVTLAENSENYMTGTSDYKINGKNVTGTVIEKYENKLSGESHVELAYIDESELTGFKKNTEANRKKM